MKKALLLAAGKSTRLYPVTLDTPKPLLPLFKDDKTLIDYWVKTCQENNIEVYINVDYLKDKIITHIINNYENVNIIECLYPTETIHILKDEIFNSEEFFIINCDTFISKFDFIQFVNDREINKTIDGCLAIDYVLDCSGKGFIEVDYNYNRITSFSEKKCYEGQKGFVWSGLASLNYSFLNKVNLDKDLYFSDVFDKCELNTFEVCNHVDIGKNIDDYLEIREKYKNIEV